MNEELLRLPRQALSPGLRASCSSKAALEFFKKPSIISCQEFYHQVPGTQPASDNALLMDCSWRCLWHRDVNSRILGEIRVAQQPFPWPASNSGQNLYDRYSNLYNRSGRPRGPVLLSVSWHKPKNHWKPGGFLFVFLFCFVL